MKTIFTRLLRALRSVLDRCLVKEKITVLLQLVNNVSHLVVAYAVHEVYKVTAALISTVVLLVLLRLLK